MALLCFNLSSALLVCLPYIMTLPSSDPVTINYLLNATAVTGLLCPYNVFVILPTLSNSIALLSNEPVKRLVSSTANEVTLIVWPL